MEVLVSGSQVEAHRFDHVVELINLALQLGNSLLHEILVGVVLSEVPEGRIDVVEMFCVDLDAFSKCYELFRDQILPLFDLINVQHQVLHLQDAYVDDLLELLLSFVQLLINFSLAHPQLVLVFRDLLALAFHELEVHAPLVLDLTELLIGVVLNNLNLVNQGQEIRLFLRALCILLFLLSLHIIEYRLLLHDLLNEEFKLVDFSFLIVLVVHHLGHVGRILQAFADYWLDH